MDTVERLQLRVSQLEEELEETRGNVFQAAECGKTLLASNQMLSDKLEKREKEFAEQLEQLEQDNHSLKMKLECQQSSASSMQQELEAALAQQEADHATQLKRLEEVNSKKVVDLTHHNDDLTGDIEKLKLQIKSFQERVKKQEEIIEQQKEEASSRDNSSALHNELMGLEELYVAEKNRNEGLELQLLEVSGQLEVSLVEISTLQHKLAVLEEECEERNKMAKEWYDALQLTKDHNAELASQLEQLNREGGGDHSKTSGNSLFGEVDDRRLNAEKKMISLKVKYESLERTYATTKQQLRKMKAEMSALLCQCSAATADAAQVQRLQRALSQSQSELQVLSGKLHRLEQLQAEGVALQDVKKYMSAFVDYGDKAEYIHFLEQELEEQRKSHAVVMSELELKRTQMIWETNKLCEAEVKLHQSEREQAKLRQQQAKLQIRNQETLEELEKVQNSCKQHEAEKQYLEEELKQRGRGKQSAVQQDITKKSPQHIADEARTVSAPAAKLTHRDSDPADSSGGTVAVERPQRTLKDVNILEDLNQELFGSQGPAIVDTKVGLVDRRPENAENRSVWANKSDQRSSGKKSQVIHVSKESVNKCPQQ